MWKNSDTDHLLMSGNKVVTNIDNNCINSEDTNELFMITTESELTFQNHINKLCKKASQELNALSSFNELLEEDNCLNP